ncbi:MAG TPA: EamA-like transporter family protein [Cyanothece sp. UBA12306]|nr:EamA-like transporter family protein [Cyanothece sp. UBA12306]
MSYKELCLLLASVLASAMGQLFLKLGATQLGAVNSGNAVSHILNILLTPALLAGLSCYGLGAIAYILLLTRVNLSVAGPSAALIYVFSVLIGYFFFKETIPTYRACGLGLIVFGVVLVVWRN